MENFALCENGAMWMACGNEVENWFSNKRMNWQKNDAKIELKLIVSVHLLEGVLLVCHLFEGRFDNITFVLMQSKLREH